MSDEREVHVIIGTIGDENAQHAYEFPTWAAMVEWFERFPRKPGCWYRIYA